LQVREAAEQWAKSSTDGGMVWEVGAELVPEIWHDWRLSLRADTWRVDRNLIQHLNEISQACNSEAVTAAVDAAKLALTSYSE
jgi:gamma-glutamylcyclotransferase (GGCT)/AIG2-like uncharacterized protein YtfP